jgi:alpha-N-arabinofuranosidase
MKRHFSAFALSCVLFSSCLIAQQPTLTVQADQPSAKVSPTLYGLMTEEINYSYDGGLYGELVRDRVPARSWGNLHNWPAVRRGDSTVHISIDEKDGPSAAITHSIKVSVTAASEKSAAGIENTGYWGIPVRPNTTYTGSFWAKTDTPGLPVTVSLENDQTGEAAATATVTGVSGQWNEYKYTLKTGNVVASTNNHLLLTVNKPTTLWLELVSLFPPTYKDRPNGNRIDLMEKMAAMHPTFLRLPGGNYLEGNHISERYDFKQTIGDLVNRPTHPSPWGYRSSDGMGILEFLEWCEDLKIEPVLAVYAGYSLEQEHIEPGTALKPHVEDALDEIEFVTGGPETHWGALRAKYGHPAAFPLHYVEIGNEDQFDHSHSYDGRYEQFYKAIKAKYPQLQLIATTPVKSIKPDVVDDHYYEAAETMFDMTDHYDKIDRNGPKIFVGEWATREGDPTPNLNAALADAAWMTGLERNSDLVVMHAYAPLLTNVNSHGIQWDTDLIGYDALSSYGSPSYYAQVIFAGHVGTEVVPAKLDGVPARIYSVATRDEKAHKLYIKLVNATSNPLPLAINLNGLAKVDSSAKLITLSGKTPNATNSLDHPTDVVPTETTVKIAGTKFQQTLVPFSVNVLELNY